VEGLCEHGNDSPSSINSLEFLDLHSPIISVSTNRNSSSDQNLEEPHPLSPNVSFYQTARRHAGIVRHSGATPETRATQTAQRGASVNAESRLLVPTLWVIPCRVNSTCRQTVRRSETGRVTRTFRGLYVGLDPMDRPDVQKWACSPLPQRCCGRLREQKTPRMSSSGI
jgi:hypothetical protein